MAVYCIARKVDDKVVRTHKTKNINELFAMRAERGDYLAEIVSGKRVNLYKWIEKELLWRPIK